MGASATAPPLKIMSNDLRIQDIATVRTGYTFRKDHSKVTRSGLLGLQIGDIRESRVVQPSRLSSVDWHGSGSPHVLEPGDVVLAAKGDRNFAAIFTDRESMVLPSSQILILSVRDESTVIPSFLCWVLNFEPTQRSLAEHHTGSNIPTLSKKVLLDVTVPVPPIEVQEAVLRLQSLLDEERRLTAALLRNREELLHGVYQRLLNGEVN